MQVEHPPAPASERRKRKRLALHWRVCFSRSSNHRMVESETRDVSSGGFYCFTDEHFMPDERLECLLIVPLPEHSEGGGQLCLHCQVEVVRVDISPPGGAYGIACRIEDYTVANFAANAFLNLERGAAGT